MSDSIMSIRSSAVASMDPRSCICLATRSNRRNQIGSFAFFLSTPDDPSLKAPQGIT